MSVQKDAKTLADTITEAVIKFEAAHSELMVENIDTERLIAIGRAPLLSSVSLRIVLICGDSR